MVDPDRLRSILRRVEDDVTRLRRYEETDTAELIGNEERMAYLERRFQTAIEGCIDAAQHVCASEGWGPPSSNADAMRVLFSHEAIDRELADAMADAVRFRNELVHLYRDVTDTDVVRRLTRLGELERFVTALAELIT